MPKNYKITPKVRETISSDKVQAAIESLYQYLHAHFDLTSNDVVLVGIQTRGAVLANRLAALIKARNQADCLVGAIDITLYRDDFSTAAIQPIVKETHLDFDINDKKIILVDDVLFTGRTIRAALDELIDFGRPQSIALFVVVDRGHRELPIEAQFSPIKVSTKRDESVNLHLQELDGKDEIVICEPIKE